MSLGGAEVGGPGGLSPLGALTRAAADRDGQPTRRRWPRRPCGPARRRAVQARSVRPDGRRGASKLSVWACGRSRIRTHIRRASGCPIGLTVVSLVGIGRRALASWGGHERAGAGRWCLAFPRFRSRRVVARFGMRAHNRGHATAKRRAWLGAATRPAQPCENESTIRVGAI